MNLVLLKRVLNSSLGSFSDEGVLSIPMEVSLRYGSL